MHWQTPLALADEGVAAVRFLRCHPLLVARGIGFFCDSPSRRGWLGEWGVGDVERIPLFHFREPLKIHISSQLLRCVKNFLLTYKTYAARRNFLRALHLGEL